MLVCFFREARLQQLLKGVQEVHQLRQQRTIAFYLAWFSHECSFVHDFSYMNVVFVYRADVPVRRVFERFRGLTNGVNNTAYYCIKILR